KLLESAEIDDPDDVLPQLEGFSEQPVVGSYAAEAANQIENMEHRRRRLYRAIEATFGAESLSRDKFIAVVDAAERTLLRNCALLSNRIQSFDVSGYRSAKRQIGSGGSSADTRLQEERMTMYENALQDMREVIEANERLLLQMGKLEIEISDLESDDNREDNSKMLEEVKGLLEETKYYR
ncbi:MAG: hypothetical protein J6A68_04525, partial [Oscillospiraceae bacterium]|nr:hypothetical protein [Oscillospiraceae bacterium]